MIFDYQQVDKIEIKRKVQQRSVWTKDITWHGLYGIWSYDQPVLKSPYAYKSYSLFLIKMQSV